MIQTRKKIGHKINRRFTEEEDMILKKLVKLYGDSNWIKISNRMPGRNSRQCKDRWCLYLSPNTNRSPWTAEEEQRLLELAKKYKKKWTEISKFFDGRPDTQIKNKWKTLVNRQEKPDKVNSPSEEITKCEKTKQTSNEQLEFYFEIMDEIVQNFGFDDKFNWDPFSSNSLFFFNCI